MPILKCRGLFDLKPNPFAILEIVGSPATRTPAPVRFEGDTEHRLNERPTKRIAYERFANQRREKAGLEGTHTEALADARDAVKKEALRKAGIGYHEVVAGHTTPGELRASMERLLSLIHI